MQGFYRIAALVLLLFNGIGAIYGGYLFISAPDGSLMQIPVTLLEHSPFTSFLIPGIILILFNGVFSLVTSICLILKTKSYPLMIVMQGAVLLIWITVQIVMIRSYDAVLHTTFLAVGFLFIFLGRKLHPKS
ncbi:MAG: hypothetical protein IAE90_13880 [Ignavibacteria bacterium]|nr:hypothetical protein [Ignavibacteria bacterium]